MSKLADNLFDRIQAAKTRLSEQAHVTPVLTSRTLDQKAGASVYLKCENFQRVGAFKFRGAYNAMSQLSEADRKRGVITHSSGNHAQAIARVGRLLGIQTTIVMPDDAPATKRAARRKLVRELKKLRTAVGAARSHHGCRCCRCCRCW